MSIRIAVIPDPQVTQTSNLDHLRWGGQYISEKKPDVIVVLGDWWDMPSLCSYDVGTKEYEGRQYIADIEAGVNAMEIFMQPIRRVQAAQRRAKKSVWKPRLVFLEGNHEYRIQRAINHDRKLEGLMGREDFCLENNGWEFHEFKEVVVADSTVTGEGVVLAQRLEQLAKQGGICVQGAIYETVPKRLPFDYENLGERQVKGFNEPVRVYAVSLS